MSKIIVNVSGPSGIGKTTIATLIHKYLKTVGFNVNVKCDHQCALMTRRSMRNLVDCRTEIDVTECNTTTTKK